MSRIYQGGGADRRFQSNKQSRRYSPTTVRGDVKRIQQEGEAALQDLRTQDRERQRKNQMSDLERNNADRFAQLQLKQEQIQEQAAFKMQQTVDNFELQNTQRDEKDKLAMQQFADKSKFELQQFGEKGQLKFEQMSENINLKNDQMQENLDLGLARLTTSANAQIQQAQMQADNATENANLSMQKAGVTALLAFADIALKGAELGVQFHDMQEKKEQKEAERVAFDDLFKLSSIQTVDNAETTQNQVEIADEQGIQSTGSNAIERENMRQPFADQTMLRDIQQQNIGSAALQFPTQFETYIYDENTRALVNGLYKTISEVNAGETGPWLRSAARDLTAAYGVTGKEAHAMVMKYGRAVESSIAAQYNQIARGKRSYAKYLRWEAVKGNARTEVAGGGYQRAYDLLYRGAFSSGIYDVDGKKKTPKEVKDMAFNALKDMADTPAQLRSILGTNSVIGQDNTQFGNQPEYVRAIEDEIIKRNNRDYNLTHSKQRLVTQQAEQIEAKANLAILQAGEDADVIAIRKQAIEELRPLGIQGLDARNRLTRAGSTNPLVYAALNEGFDIGRPPSTAEIMEAAATGAINTEQKKYLLNRGKTSDQIEQVLTAAGMPSAKDQLTLIAKAALASGGLSGPEHADLAQMIVNAELEDYENELRKIVINNADQPSSVIQQKVQAHNTETRKRFYTNNDIKVWEKVAPGLFQYKFGDKPKLAPYRRNESSGKANRSFVNHKVNEIATHFQGASVNDAYLSREQFLDAAEAWRNNTEHTPRVKALAKMLGISPSAFVRRQSRVLGFGQIDKVPDPGRATGDLTIDPELKDALNVLGKYESETRGDYNAVNQGGTNEGRTPLGYSGDSSKSALFGYKGVSDMTIAEIQQRQNISAGSRAQFEAAGGLHAVGRYQFIAPTLAWVVEKTGISLDTQFTPEVQDYLAGWLLANSHNGIGQWVGPRENALPHEKQIVAKARLKLQDAYRILQNPNATEIQVARAQRVVGNPFL